MIELRDPFGIGPNLEPGIKLGQAWVTVSRTDRRSRSGSPLFRWTVLMPDGRTFSRADLTCGTRPTHRHAMESLLGFLCAFADAIWYERRTGRAAEHIDLFPTELREWADRVGSDEFGLYENWLIDQPDVWEET